MFRLAGYWALPWFLFWALLGGAAAQAPVLVITPTSSNQQILIYNSYTAAATAYVIESDNVLSNTSEGCHAAIDAQDRCVAMSYEHVDTAIFGDQAFSIGLKVVPAGGSIQLGSPGANSNPARNTGVIYADGATAGIPVVVAKLLRARLATLQDIDRMTPILRAILAEQPLPTRQQVWQRIHAMDEKEIAELNPDFTPGHPVLNNYRAGSQVFATLNATRQKRADESLTLQLRRDISMFQVWKANLLKSLPKLPYTDPDASGSGGGGTQPQ